MYIPKEEELLKLIDTVAPHTVKKFELVTKYIETWAYKLLGNNYCNTILYIDCMSNCGIYRDKEGNYIEGTAILVANKLKKAIETYNKNSKNLNKKEVILCFNDLSELKINLLKRNLPEATKYFKYKFFSMNANEMLKRLSKKLFLVKKLSYFLFYDPYNAEIDWNALDPYFQHWGEVLINHMIYDSVRGVIIAKKKKTIEKYENTYQRLVDELRQIENKNDFEKIIEQHILEFVNDKEKYYISSFPFFNTKNGLVYNLIHCSNHIEGFKLFKKSVWKTFEGHSSLKKVGNDNLILPFFNNSIIDQIQDNECYNIRDIALYLDSKYTGKEITNDEIIADLDMHPLFPSEGFLNQIKEELKRDFKVKIKKQSIIFYEEDNE